MESSTALSLFLPLALSIIMLGMGLSLSFGDFQRVMVLPRLVVTGLLLQFVGMPVLALGIAHWAGLGPELAVGLMVIAACPIGTIANLMVHLSRGDTALSIIFTALSSLISVLTIPPLINASTHYFMEKKSVVHLPFWQTVLQIFLMIILPVGLGMLMKIQKPNWARRLERPLKVISLLFLIIIVAGAIIKERARIPEFLLQAGAAAFVLNCAAMLLGYLMARICTKDRAEGRAIMIGTGMRNGTLGIALASSPALLNNPTMAIPAAIYSLSMFLTVSVVVGWMKFRARQIPGNLVIDLH